MNYSTIFFGIFLSTAMLFAGGNTAPILSEIAEVPNKICKENKIYIEEDAGLMWQDQAYTDAEDGAYKRNHSLGKAGSWGHATNYCRSLKYAGHMDWRLPTSDELIHMHRHEGQLFVYFRDGEFWTSTPSTDRRYYTIFPADAYPYKRKMNASHYIRCVRCTKQ